MGSQRNMSQMNEQNKAQEKELNKMEMSTLPDAEFKTLVIKMLKDLSENFHKKIGNITVSYTHLTLPTTPYV